MPEPLPYSSDKGCPYCGNYDATRVTFTWWGGLLGPKLLHHVKCRRCNKCFNRRTGTSNTTAIVVYIAISGVVFFVVALLLVMSGFISFR